MKPIRWSGEHDRYLGPFTYVANDYKTNAILLGSGDGDDYPGCRLRFSFFARTLIIALPPIVKPRRSWVDTTNAPWNKDKDGPQGYWEAHEREYGFTYSDGHLSIHYGAQTDSWPGEARWGCFLPWTQWRHVRHSLYDAQGQHYADYPTGPFLDTYEDREKLKAECGTVDFDFLDFDGERLSVKTRIEEREWHFGTGYFKWLSWFRRPKISRSLDLTFSGETGKRKGSWKGGTIGHSIGMDPGELHTAAFRRYCQMHGMTFIGSPGPKLEMAGGPKSGFVE